jgi:hypothetical protein
MSTSMKDLSHRWPAALGLMTAAFVLVTGADRETGAIIVGVATLCYLGAAALDRRWIAWAGCLGGGLVVTVGEIVGVPWWVAVGVVAAGLVVIGLFLGVPRRALTTQTVALAGFGAVAVAALFLAPTLGLVLAGLALVGHGGWDLYHYRRDEVVSRSLAEFCMLLDVPVGLGLVVIAAAG